MKTKIGGQAVLEGVMMRGATSMALAVRDENGTIRLDTTRLAKKKPWYKKVPFLRGVINLVLSMIEGMKIIGKSAEVMVEEEIDSDSGFGGIMIFSMLLGLVLAMVLFVFLPTQLTNWIMTIAGIESVKWVRSAIEGVVKLSIIIGYMWGISHLKDIRRLYQYHGAEHKTIACYESEMPLVVGNVQKCSRYHDRCGTSFIVFVMIMSVLLMIAVEAVSYAVGFEAIAITWVRTLIKIAMLPLTAGISYELLMVLARSNFVLFRPLKWMGKQVQKITTKEPDDSMCQVAITAFCKVLEMDEDYSVPEVHFPEPMTLDQFRQVVKPLAVKAYGEQYNVDYLIADILKVDDDKLREDMKIPFGWQVRVDKYIERYDQGEPIQQIVGSVVFFERRFHIDKAVLIPRQETELVVEQALRFVDEDSRVLDLCCGSGVIGITLQLQTGAKVLCSDISGKAISLTKANAKKLGAKIDVNKGDMLEGIGGKYDVIVCNPPYIPTHEMKALDKSVVDYEPHRALHGGLDGLDYYKILATKCKKLTANGVMVMEIGYNQGDMVKQLFVDANFGKVEVINDYSGNNRIVIAYKAGVR